MSWSDTRRTAAAAMLFFLLAGRPALAATPEAASAGPQVDPALRAAVEADWLAQELRDGRQPQSPQAIHAAHRRATRLLANLAAQGNEPDFHVEREALARAESDLDKLNSLDETSRLNLYVRLRWLTRTAALKNPLVADKPLVFMKRRRFVSQMLHEYLGYFYDYGDIAGGGVYLLPKPGRSLQVRDLVQGRLPRGNYTTLAVSPDARTLYFAFAERASGKPDYYSPERRCFHIFADGCRRCAASAS